MQRGALLLAVCGAVFSAGLLIHSINSGDSLDSSNTVTTVADFESIDPDAQRSETLSFDQEGEQGEASASSTLASESVARWIREASGDDSVKRAAAISALGAAPKSLAVPVLQKIFNAGAEGDRQIALNSLRMLALNQGDDDGVIRDTLRLTVYDGDDYVVADVQAALEEIEHSLDEVASSRNP